MKTPLGRKMNKPLRNSAKKAAVKYNPTPYLRSVIAEGEREFAEHKRKGTLKSFKSVDALIKELNS